MPSLERFFDPQIRKFDLNIKSLPGARFYFFQNGTTTPKAVYQDKAGTIPHTNPVIADSSGSFAPIFLDGLYRVELRSNANIVQPGWPIDSVGQDSAIVPFGPWVEIVTYNEGEVVTGSNGNWYRSIGNGNLGNDPISSPADWEVIPIPAASSFTSDADYLTWSDDGDQISLDVDETGLLAAIGYEELEVAANGNLTGTFKLCRIGNMVTITTIGGLTHASASSRQTDAGCIPSQFMPTQNVAVCANANTGPDYITRILIDALGTFFIDYTDYAGAPFNRTNSGFSVTISYNIQ